VRCSRELVDLRYLDYEAKGFSLANCPTCTAFAPTGPGDMLWEPLRDFLASLEMSTVIERLEARSLWFDPADAALAALRAHSVDAFTGFEAG
jgi:hypothetical protein